MNMMQEIFDRYLVIAQAGNGVVDPFFAELYSTYGDLFFKSQSNVPSEKAVLL